jgi:hypothetical protein
MLSGTTRSKQMVRDLVWVYTIYYVQILVHYGFIYSLVAISTGSIPQYPHKSLYVVYCCSGTRLTQMSTTGTCSVVLHGT